MRIKNLPSIESMDGSQDALIIEQTDGSEDKSRKVSPAQIKQYVLNDMDDVPTADSNNPVKSGGIYNTMGVPRVDTANRRMYLEGGAAFDGNIDSSPTAGSNNAVASGGTKTYVDNAVATKRSLTASSSVIGDAVNIANATSTSPYTTPHEGFVRVRGNASGETYLYICDKLALIVPNFNSLTSIWLPKGVPLYFDNQHYAPGLAQWFNCSND